MTVEKLHHASAGEPEIVTVSSEELEVKVVPTQGARITSLRSRHTGREWLWHPPVESNRSWESGLLGGIDECLPTIAPCILDGRALPDHGEAWRREWSTRVNGSCLTNEIELRCLPLRLARHLRVMGSQLQFDYELSNTGAEPVSWIWAWHPLFRWETGDEVILEGSSPVRLGPVKGRGMNPGDVGDWPSPCPGIRLDRGFLGLDSETYCKAYLSTARASSMTLRKSDGACLRIEVDPQLTPHWGYWLSLGGWDGHTHLALEPASSASEAPNLRSEHLLAPRESRHWAVKLAVSAGT